MAKFRRRMSSAAVTAVTGTARAGHSRVSWLRARARTAGVPRQHAASRCRPSRSGELVCTGGVSFRLLLTRISVVRDVHRIWSVCPSGASVAVSYSQCVAEIALQDQERRADVAECVVLLACPLGPVPLAARGLAAVLASAGPGAGVVVDGRPRCICDARPVGTSPQTSTGSSTSRRH